MNRYATYRISVNLGLKQRSYGVLVFRVLIARDIIVLFSLYLLVVRAGVGFD